MGGAEAQPWQTKPDWEIRRAFSLTNLDLAFIFYDSINFFILTCSKKNNERK